MRGCPEEASANFTQDAEDVDGNVTDDSLVVNAEACALAGVKPSTEGHRGIRLAVGSLANSRPDSCEGEREGSYDVRTFVHLDAEWKLRTETASVHEVDREGRGGSGAADKSEENDSLHMTDPEVQRDRRWAREAKGSEGGEGGAAFRLENGKDCSRPSYILSRTLQR